MKTFRLYLTILKYYSFQITNVVRAQPGVYEVTVTSSAPALFVWLTASDVIGRFSDNGFLQVRPEVTVEFDCDVHVTLSAQQFMAQLSVKSLTEI